MGINVTCDCCQKPIDNASEFGYVSKVYACDDCAELYRDFYKSVDVYHDKIALEAKRGMEIIRLEWLKKHLGAILPK